MKKVLGNHSDKGLEVTCEQGTASLEGRESFSFSPIYSDKGLEARFDNLNRIPLEPCMAGIHAVYRERTNEKNTFLIRIFTCQDLFTTNEPWQAKSTN